MVRPAGISRGDTHGAGPHRHMGEPRAEFPDVAPLSDVSLSPAQKRLEAGSVAENSLMPLAFPHVVVMDSDLEVLEKLGHMLHQFSISVTMVSDVLDLQTLKRIAPNVIVFGISGERSSANRDLLHQLRSDVRTSRIPALTCVHDPGMGMKSRECKAQRCFGLMQKPYNFDDLVAAILGEITVQEFHHGTHHYD